MAGGRRGVRRAGALIGAATVVLACAGAPAVAQPASPRPPSVGPGEPGPAPVVAAPVADPAAVKKTECLGPPRGGGDPLTSAGWPQQQLGFTAAWDHGRGAGQTIAVIDTGVNPLPRLNVRAAGDYVDAAGDGALDCDGHGTIVASILGAAPVEGDDTGYSGVAPDATLLSIRQYSAYYETTREDGSTSTPGDVSTLAQAVVWAADQGATVINISEAACGPTTQPLRQDAELGGALRYAVDVEDVVVVVAAGNVATSADAPCQPNPSDGTTPPVTAVSPAWWDDYVLAVGSVGESGLPSEFTLAGPWVDVAAPGEGIVSLDPVVQTPLSNALVPPGGNAEPIQGTSFAAPFVAGTAALVRQRYPELTARQVMARIEATAHAPSGGFDERVGYGTVDPVAAVDDVLPADVQPQALDATSAAFEVPPTPAPPSTTPRTVAFVGSAVALGAVLVTLAVLNAVQRSRRTQR